MGVWEKSCTMKPKPSTVPRPYQLIFFSLVEEHTMILPKLFLHLATLFSVLKVLVGWVKQC